MKERHVQAYIGSGSTMARKAVAEAVVGGMKRRAAVGQWKVRWRVWYIPLAGYGGIERW